MTYEIRIITNNVPRDVIDAWELTPKEREDFDYLDWEAIERGEESASFFRYKGSLYDLGDTPSTRGMSEDNPMTRWDGYISDSFFSGVLVRYVGDDCEQVIIGRYLA